MNLVSKFVEDNLKGFEEMVLAVNFKNEGAYRVYLKSGFIGCKIVDGRKGPQHVLAKKI